MYSKKLLTKQVIWMDGVWPRVLKWSDYNLMKTRIDLGLETLDAYHKNLQEAYKEFKEEEHI